MRRVVLETLVVFAVLAAVELLVLKGAEAAFGVSASDAGLWGGLLIVDVFAASLLAGARRLRRAGPPTASLFWGPAALAVGAAAALGLVWAAKVFPGVALLLPRDSLPSAAFLSFLLASFAARLSFWAASQGLEAFREEPEEAEAGS